MADIRMITDIRDPALDVYSRTPEVQLLRLFEPNPGIFIAESPKVVQRALDGGYEPISILAEKGKMEGEADEVIKRCGDIPLQEPAASSCDAEHGRAAPGGHPLLWQDRKSVV